MSSTWLLPTSIARGGADSINGSISGHAIGTVGCRNGRERQHVTRVPRAECPRREGAGQHGFPRAHYMRELSHEGFAIADFIHEEGNGALWDLALEVRSGATRRKWM